MAASACRTSFLVLLFLTTGVLSISPYWPTCGNDHYNSGTDCIPCSSLSTSCVTCSSATNCTGCISPFVANGGACSCQYGYYYSSPYCRPCNVPLPGCLSCISATNCTSCDTTIHLNASAGVCVCQNGYINVSNTCTGCSAGCLSCTSPTVCTSCSAAANFIPSGTACICTTGLYLSGGSCVSCPVACTICSSATVCTGCNATLHYITGPGSTCICDAANGYKLVSGTCQHCLTWLPGCATCTVAANCTSCGTIYNQTLTLSSGNCSCPLGYTFNTTANNCSLCPACCPIGKYLNTAPATATCDLCNTIFPQCTVCIVSVCYNCTVGYLPNANNTICDSCSSLIPGCSACTSNTFCLSCNASPNFYLNGTTCACVAGYAISTANTCLACSAFMPGCLICPTNSSCTSCDTANNFIVDPNNASQCACKAGFYLSGSSCVVCPNTGAMAGCLVCSSVAVCTSCDTTLHYLLVGSNCSCDSGYYLTGVGGTCSLCTSAMPGCLICTSSSTCTSCDTVGLFQPNSTWCSCISGYYLSAANICKPCPIGCTDCDSTGTTCSGCVAGLIPVAPICGCSVGFYLNNATVACDPCSNIDPQCLACTDTACQNCNLGYIVNLGKCVTCLNIPGCLTCDAVSCTSCDAFLSFVLSGTDCLCSSGFAMSALNTCLPCSTNLTGCLQCSTNLVCTTCDTANNFVPDPSNSSKCACASGFYLSGSSCVSCPTIGNMVGCLTCSSANVCTFCDATLFYQLVGSNCSCDSGYYLTGVGGICLLCSSAIPGCLNCTGPNTCTSCDTPGLFLLVASSCQCNSGYSLSVANTCVSCPVGCQTCDATGTSCSLCSTDFDLISSQCFCKAGTYLPLGGSSCLPCVSIYPMCLVCTETSCTSCTLPFIVTGIVCDCPVGSYNDTLTTCALCSGLFLGCDTCNISTCSNCDTALFFNATPVANACVCQPGYTMQTSTCKLCSTLIVGCLNCSSPTYCDICDATLFFNASGGSCLCIPTYFFNSTSQQCQTCSSAINGCQNCSSGTVCTTCNATIHFASLPLANGTCGCASMYVPNGTDCISCFVNCVCIGYQRDITGSCVPFCSDNITITPTEGCDDGNLVDGDGCSSVCKIEVNFTCTLDANLSSSCSYNQPLNMTFIETFKSPNTNQLTFKLKIGPALPSLAKLNFSHMFTSSVPLENSTYVYDPVDGTLALTYDFNSSLHGKNISLTISPGVEPGFNATPPTAVAFSVLPRNNLPALPYDNQTYDKFTEMDRVYKAAAYTSYALFAVGMVCDKVIGVQLFGVLQLAHLATSNLDSVQPLLSPLMNLSMVNGFNLELSRSVGLLPNRVRQIQYDQLFLNNFNIMLGLMLLEMAVASVLLIIGALGPRYRRQKLTSIGTSMLKEYLLMMIIFNSYNISYSLGIQLAYPDSANKLLTLSAVITAASVLFPAVIVGAMLFTEKKEVGEFCSHFKSDPICKGYFVLTLLYRMVLGQSMGRLNEFEDVTLVHVFYAIIFLLYLLINRPYVKAYHNYRAVVVQATGLTILSVTMYYRSMKSTTEPSVTYQILSPALVEVAAIFASIAISAACVFYELYLKIKQWTKSETPKKTSWPFGIRQQVTEMEVTDEPPIPIP